MSQFTSIDATEVVEPDGSLTGFIRLPQVLALVPISRTTLWRHVAAGTFPAPVKLFASVTAWRVEDVRSWIDAQSGSTPNRKMANLRLSDNGLRKFCSNAHESAGGRPERS